MRVVRASEADRVLSCPGSATLCDIVGPSKPNAASIEGDVIHFQVATKLIIELGAAGAENLRDPGVGPFHQLSPFAEWIVGYCFREVRDNLPEGWSLEVELGMAYKLGPESTREIVDPRGQPGTEELGFSLSGHLDVLAVNPDSTEAIGWDFKGGYVPVDPAEMNEQVLCYLVLLKLAYPKLTKATFKIVQPRNDEDEGYERVSSVTVEGEALENCVASLTQRIASALSRPMELETGHKQCKYCAAQLVCPALRQEIELMKMTLTKEMLAKITQEPDDAALGDIVIAAKTLSGPMDAAEKLLHERLDANPAIQAGCGVAITRKIENGAMKCVDPVRTYTALVGLVKPEKLAPALNYPTGRIKDAIADALNVPKTGKAAITAQSVFDAKLGMFFEQGTRKRLIFS